MSESPEMLEYRRSIEQYVNEASANLESGDFAGAAAIWEMALATPDMVQYFDDDQLGHLRSRVDWARGHAAAHEGSSQEAARRWQAVADAGNLDQWYGSDGAEEIRFNLALHHRLAGDERSSETVMSQGLSDADRDEIRGVPVGGR